MAEFTSLNGYAVKDSVARSIAKGRNQAVAFVDYATMIEALNEYEKDEFKAGQNIYIGVVGVPDLWVYSVEDIRHTYIYESDEDVVEKLTTNTTIQAGFFKLAMLEGQKVDLTTYDQHLAKHDEDIAKIETKIEEHDEELESLNNCLVASDNLKFRFSTDGEGKYGFLGADDSFIPFKSGLELESCNIESKWVKHNDGNPIQYTTATKIVCIFASTGTNSTGEMNRVAVATQEGSYGSVHSGLILNISECTYTISNENTGARISLLVLTEKE